MNQHLVFRVKVGKIDHRLIAQEELSSVLGENNSCFDFTYFQDKLQIIIVSLL